MPHGGRRGGLPGGGATGSLPAAAPGADLAWASSADCGRVRPGRPADTMTSGR